MYALRSTAERSIMSIKIREGRWAAVGGIAIARLLPNKDKQPMGVCYVLDHVRPPDFAGQQYAPDALIRFDRRDMTDQQSVQLTVK